MIRRRLILGLCLCVGFLHGNLDAQTQFPFQLKVATGAGSATVSNGTTVNLTSNSVGVPSTLTLTAVYVGSTPAVISATPQLLGSSDFSITASPTLPLNLATNDTFTVVVTYTPSSAAASVAQLNILYLQPAAGQGQTTTAGAITLNITGSIPQISVNYALQANANVLALPPGGTLQFLPTPVGTTAVATVIILNSGSAPGVINSVAVSGSAFQPIGLPLLPTTLAGGGNLQFLIQYSPKQNGVDQGTLTIGIGGTTFTANLAGSGIGSNYSYAFVNGGTTTAVAPGQPIALPDANIGQTTSVGVQFRNTGNAVGVVNAIAVSGNGFSLADLPLIPLSLAPNDLATFTINFTPQQPGPATGTLRIGNDLFALTSNGIGVNLIYSYAAGGTSVSVLPSGVVLFSPVMVSQTAFLPFTIKNTGTLGALISSIGVAGGASQNFSLSDVPALPFTIKPGESVTFSIAFSPLTVGQQTATLLVNAQSFTISGFGTSPPPLPTYQITGPSGQVNPFDQPSISLTLLQPYAVPVNGKLTLSVNSNAFAADPSVQFSTGGTVVTFTIPANQTKAIFPGGATQIRFQTGTVAGTITVTPTFLTASGLDLTPANPTTLVLTLPKQAPTLLSAVVSAEATNGFTLTTTGYVTTRTLTKLTFTFTLISGVTSPTTTFSVDVSQVSALWFGGSASQAFGGQFSISVPFSLQGTLTNALQSVTVTATNEIGTSNTVTTALQ